jgi:hypothetical protein
MCARGSVSLHSPPLLGRKLSSAKSRVSITCKLIENARLQARLYTSHKGVLRCPRVEVLMEIWMFVCTAISALTGMITAAPILGADLRIWGKEMQEIKKQAASAAPSKTRYWVLFTISTLALVFSTVGIVSSRNQYKWPPVNAPLQGLEVVQLRPFAYETVELDGKRFLNCKFDHVTLIYRGLKPYNLSNNEFIASKFKIANGPAFTGATIAVLAYEGACNLQNPTACDITKVPKIEVLEEEK